MNLAVQNNNGQLNLLDTGVLSLNADLVDTDYTTYALVRGCWSVGIFHNSYTWILSPQQTMSSSALANAEASASARIPEFNSRNMYQVNQSGCSNY